jgi:gamma-glutamylcysteine synthetase
LACCDGLDYSSHTQCLPWPPALHRIGTEHEKLGFRLRDHTRMGLQEIEQLLGLMQRRHGWQPLMEGGHLLGGWARPGWHTC